MLATASLCTAVLAAPSAVEAFDVAQWTTLKTQVQRPTVVVFTATYCPSCPAAFEQITRAVAQQRLGLDVVGVVMDRAPGDDDATLLKTPYYQGTQRLMAFDGPAATLRHAVDPQWRGVTPFLVVLKPGHAPRTWVGPASAKQLQAWTRP
jgi:thiol-disulfide isomerase/thioredoxin